MKPPLQARRKGEQGYVLLMLLLATALLIIALGAIVQSVKFDVERDREEEMIHRGVQYERAIKLYYKKFGRYPTKIEDLENTNTIRFLRKRYKDPTNCHQGKCEDFKLLHFGEVKLAFSGGIGGGTIPGASPIGSQGGLGQTSTFGSGSGFGQTSTFGTGSAFGQSSSFGGNSGLGTNPNAASGGNQTSAPQQPGSDTSQTSSTDTTGTQSTGPNPPGTGDNTNNGNSSSPGDTLSTQVFGGGPIIGVASLSKKKGYREFNHKKKYNEWQFIYDPGTDRGGLLTTPYQPLVGFSGAGKTNLNGTPNSGNNPGTGTGFGNSTSFGPTSGPQPPGQQNPSEGPEVPQPNNSPNP